MPASLEETSFNLQNYLQYTEPSLKGKSALITGASSGFGLAVACRLAQENVSLTLVARRHDRLVKLQESLLERFPKLQVKILASDIRSPDFFTALHKQDLDNCDILINNAGLAAGLDPIATANLQDWEQMINTNITAAFKLVHAVLPKMIAKGSGHIVNIASIAGHESYEKGSVYCATKHALISFTKALRMEVCDKNIRVSLVSPGMAETEFSLVRFNGNEAQAESVYKGITPLSAMDVAHQIMFCLKQPSHVNIDELLVKPTAQGSAFKVYRKP